MKRTRATGVKVVKMNTTMMSASKKHWSAANSYKLMLSTDIICMRLCTGAGHTTENEAQKVPMICGEEGDETPTCSGRQSPHGTQHLGTTR